MITPLSMYVIGCRLHDSTNVCLAVAALPVNLEKEAGSPKTLLHDYSHMRSGDWMQDYCV